MSKSANRHRRRQPLPCPTKDCGRRGPIWKARPQGGAVLVCPGCGRAFDNSVQPWPFATGDAQARASLAAAEATAPTPEPFTPGAVVAVGE